MVKCRRHTISLFIAAWGFAIALLSLCSSVDAAVAIGQPAPPLTVTRLDGTKFSLGDLRGQVVIVNLWATWCPPCRAEMPILDAVYRRYQSRGLQLIGLSVDSPHDRKAVARTISAFSYPAALLSDAEMNGFGTPGILPTTYIVDASGIIRTQVIPTAGALTEESLAKLVLPLLQ